MGKATYLADLYQKSVEILTQNRTEWMGLLSSVSKYYKLSFDKNVLIYVQRPDAGLLATKMGWEKQTGRYLKAGCKGIGVVDMDNPKATLTYYFDLADTRGSYDGFRAAMNAVWELERQYQPEIMHRFHIQFRTDTTSIENCLCQLVQMQGKAYMAKYNPKLEVKDENSVLYGLPEKAVQEEFARLVSDSAAYIVFRKCGIQPDVFEETGAFQNISHFNSTEMFMALGYHATAIAKPVLMEINRQIEEIKEERSRRYEQRTISEDDTRSICGAGLCESRTGTVRYHSMPDIHSTPVSSIPCIGNRSLFFREWECRKADKTKKGRNRVRTSEICSDHHTGTDGKQGYLIHAGKLSEECRPGTQE